MKLAAFIFGSIPLLIQLYSKKYLEEDKAKTLDELQNDAGIPRIQTFDFIIVGAGTAGSIVAGRLSEKFNVLLLEAGGTPVPQSAVSYFTRYVGYDPDINYVYKTIPQKNASLETGGIIQLTTGKMLGGSGSHNDMIHQRGSPLDYDNYARISNDQTWTYANVLQYFKKSEDFIGTLLNPEQAEYYGKGGPLTVDTHLPLILPKWFDAGRELGYPIADPNAQQIESFAPFEKLISKGQRVSTYNRYVKPFEGTRQNLTVIKYAEVTEVLIDRVNRAYGVAYLRHGIPQIAHASKEVIISAGTINSPLILMKSGVGARSVLVEAGIPVKVDRPAVGQNFADHVTFVVAPVSYNESSVGFIPQIPEDQFEAELLKYSETGVGEFGDLQEGPQAILVSSRAKADGETTWPDSLIIGGPGCPMSLEDDVKTTSCFVVVLERPKSKGSVTLNTTAHKAGVQDYTQLAVIDFNFFSDPSDMDVMLDGIDLILRIVENTTAFQSMGAKFEGTSHPACTQFIFRSKDYWKCHLQQSAGTTIHMVGTCAIGSSPDSVTDSKLKVRGVTNLRVVDASVLPETPNANINGPVILVAEKAADDILKSW